MSSRILILLLLLLALAACDAGVSRNIGAEERGIFARQTSDAAGSDANAFEVIAQAERARKTEAAREREQQNAHEMEMQSARQTSEAFEAQRADLQKTEDARDRASALTTREAAAQKTATAAAQQTTTRVAENIATATAIIQNEKDKNAALLAAQQVKDEIAKREDERARLAATLEARKNAAAISEFVAGIWFPAFLIVLFFAALGGLALLFGMGNALVLSKLKPPTAAYTNDNALIGYWMPGALGYRMKTIDQLQSPLARPALPSGEIIAPQDDLIVPNENELISRALNLTEQPNRVSMPLGVSRAGDEWLELDRAGHTLIGGPSGSGKTSLVHGFIMALERGALVELYLYGGEKEFEFSGYVSKRTHLVAHGELARTLDALLAEMKERFVKFAEVGVRNLETFNVRSDDGMRRVALVIDELKTALAEPGVEAQITSLARLGRAAGIHVIMATQFPDAKTVPTDLRGNATTRISFAVASPHNSIAILGTAGAEKLPRVPGRMLVDTYGERKEIQAFQVTPPAPQATPTRVSLLNDLERRILLLALQQADAGGRYWLKVKETAATLGMDDSVVTEIALAWEAREWVSGEKMNVGRKGKNGRQVLPRLLDIALGEGILKNKLDSQSDAIATNEQKAVAMTGDMVRGAARIATKQT